LRITPRLSRLSLALLLLSACSGGGSAPSAPTPSGSSTTPAPAIPAQGTATTLDIGNWNVEWFGDAENGPANEALQAQNVRSVMNALDVDVWGLVEVVSAAQFQQLVAGLTGFAGALATDAAVRNGALYYGDYNNAEQKVALVWKTSVASLVDAKVILAERNLDFAGRPPVEFTLRVTLNGVTENAVFIVLHAKAGATSDDWNKRDPASAALKAYLDATYPTQKVWVIGDWNDDVDTSIAPGKASPYANFVLDAARYAFPTRALSLAGVSSTTGFGDFIDHQLATNEALALLAGNATQAFRADGYIANYATTTSDHYPVLSRWNWGSAGSRSIARQEEHR
jgi:hypothetical protein